MRVVKKMPGKNWNPRQGKDKNEGETLRNQTEQSKQTNKAINADPEPGSWQIVLLAPAAEYLYSDRNRLAYQEGCQGSNDQVKGTDTPIRSGKKTD